MKPAFALVSMNYPSNRTVSQEQLFREIGWDDLIGNQAYENTCAIRVSLALLKAGVNLRGRIPVKKGPQKGRAIEPGQARLSHMLAETGYFGSPQKLNQREAIDRIGNRRGVVSFWQVPGYLEGRGGHIDIVSNMHGFPLCGSSCFWSASQVWFWELL